MHFKRILAINALMLIYCGIFMMIPAITDMVTQKMIFNSFTISACITISIGLFLHLLCPKDTEPLRPKEMFLTTTLMWLLYASFAAIPFYLPPHNISLSDAFFEAMSGLTGTGSTIFTNLENETAGTLLWRSLSQWLGGIGIIVVAIIVLPTLKIGGMQLFATESTSLTERINPTMRQSIRDILIYFCLLSVMCMLLLWWSGMSFFDAVNHSMTALSTGGFSTHDKGIMYFKNPATIWILIFAMILGALPLVLGPYLFKRRWEIIQQNVQIKTFFKTLILGCILLIPVVGLQNLQQIIFQVTSILTTTGFVIAPYSSWGVYATTVLLFLTACGSCTGSTSGGIKSFRFTIIGQVLITKMKSLIKPFGVFVPSYGTKVIDEEIVSGVLFFLSLFILTFVLSTLALTALGLDLLTALSSSLSCVANVGPALGEIVGPEQTYANLPNAAKWILSFVMLAGRLEFTSLMVLFLPFLWRKNT